MTTTTMATTTAAATPAALHLTGAQADFHSPRYLRNTARRLEHLATLGLDLPGRSVLELGAGIGDLTTFFLDRGCTVHSTEARGPNLAILRQRYAGEPRVTVAPLDLDPPPAPDGRVWEVVFSYGLLYHLSDPQSAISFMSACCGDMLLLESICTPGAGEQINPKEEDRLLAGAAVTGRGCRPTRGWIHRRLLEHFDFVYVPQTQPCHDEFPLDWTLPGYSSATRAIFVATRRALSNPVLLSDPPRRYERST